MKLSELISKYWNDIFPDKVIHLSTYRFERNKKYPGVGYRFFKDWRNQKAWLLSESKRIAREWHNKGVLERFFASKEQDPNKPNA